ncbi:MAG TPA: circadian clock KaiB family protein [Flavisolibacter sp.]|nr:circadian clock KaiB family protein [Flavisolibacter sp.]
MTKNESQDNTGKVQSGSVNEYELRLYISGASANSVKAVNNIKQICEGYIKNNYTLEVIDVHQQQNLAEKEQLIALPMLIRKKPLPERKLIGDMSDTKKVLKGLGLPV